MVVPTCAVRTMELLSVKHLLRQHTGLPETVGQAIREYVHGELDLVVFSESTDPDCGTVSANVSTIPLDIDKTSRRWSSLAAASPFHFKAALRGPHALSRHVVKWMSFDRHSGEHGFRVYGEVGDEEGGGADEEEPALWCISMSHAAAPFIRAEPCHRNVQVEYTIDSEGQVDAGCLLHRSGNSLFLRAGHVIVSSGWQWAAVAFQGEWDIYDIIDIVVFDTSSGQRLHTEHVHCVPSVVGGEQNVSMLAEHSWLVIQTDSHLRILKRAADHSSFHNIHSFDRGESIVASLSAQIFLHNDRAVIRLGNTVQLVRLEDWVKEWTIQKSNHITSVSCSNGVVAVACARREWSEEDIWAEFCKPSRQPCATIDLLDAGSGECFQRVKLKRMTWAKFFCCPGLQVALKDQRFKVPAVSENLSVLNSCASQMAMFTL